MLKQIEFTKLPITEVVDEIIYIAAEAGASDIHFDPTEKNIKVRFRIDGVLIDYSVIPEFIKKNLIARLKIISGMDITESRLPQDGAIKTTIKNVNLDMRVSSLPTNLGEKIVIRILDYSSSLNGLESLGFETNNLEKIKSLIKEPNGIILVTGATGSGKSTTVYSLLQQLNTPEVNIVTVEDPVEMNMKGINQIQVNSEIGLTFAEVLRSILRQDPDIIMIGEIRDDETAKIAVRASITGHLVLSTLHTNNALNTIERLRDMEVETYLLASSLNGVVSQKLARRICPHCMKKRPAIEYEKQLIKTNLGIDINELAYSEGCEECVGGYKGRIAIHEVLVINDEIRDAISDGMQKEDLKKLVYTNDTTTLLQDGLKKVIDNKTTIEEVLRLVELDDESVRIINQKNTPTASNNTSDDNSEEEMLDL
ncbi:MAG: type II/IV secretion system protein [Bacilli bacterium]|nr:type II/IV secretion system protein [Bacilli bacterium]